MSSAELEQLAALIREAKYPILVGASGIPAAVEEEAWPERMDLFAAVTKGYNTAQQIMASQREHIQRLEQRLKIIERLEAAAKKGA